MRDKGRASEEEEEMEEEEESDSSEKKKKKQKKKKKKACSDSDESDGSRKKRKKKDKKSKSNDKKKKKEEENFAEMYEKELKEYCSEDCLETEDEYNKKKVYEVVTVTGDVRGAGSDAKIFVTLFGEFGITPKAHLTSKSESAFERSKTDVFRVRTNNVGTIRKIRIEHDNTSMNPSWFLDRVIVTDMNRPHLRFYFPCNNWLSKDDGDGLNVRDLLGTLNPMDVPKGNKYVVRVFTADINGSGTDADVFINIFGQHGDTGERKLDNDNDNFERGQEDKFTLDAPNVGKLRKINIGHNNKGGSAGWFLDKVLIEDIGNKANYEFPCHRWLARNEDDGKIQRDILVGGAEATGMVYKTAVMTGDVRGAGTNSKIHIVMHGSKGLRNSGKVFLEGGEFERARTDLFNIEIAAFLSPLSRVSIGHDNCGVSSGWHCEKVTVYCPFTGIEQTFPCGKWLDEDEGDGLVERELYEMLSLRKKRLKKFPWSMWLWTSDMRGAGTDAAIYFQLFGDKGKSDEMKLDSNSDNFEAGQLDKFMLELPDLGTYYKLRIWHEKRTPFAGWHLQKVTLLKTLTKEKYTFRCNRWLDSNEDDREIVRELSAEGPLVAEVIPVIKYRVTVVTGSVPGSGTDAKVFASLIGEQGDTGDRMLVNSLTTTNKFEKGSVDEFIVEAVNLKQVRRVRIGHFGRGGSCGWYLGKVIVRQDGQPESEAVEFPCFRWFDKNEDDGLIIRELVPEGRSYILENVGYHISIKTGDVPGASSDSKVLIKMYGEKGDTKKEFLLISDNDLDDQFERGRTDIFTLDTRDIGKIKRLLIGHDNIGLQAGWHLGSVQVNIPVHGLQYNFPCNRWLDEGEADGKVEIEVYPSEIVPIEIRDVPLVSGPGLWGPHCQLPQPQGGRQGRREEDPPPAHLRLAYTRLGSTAPRFSPVIEAVPGLVCGPAAGRRLILQPQLRCGPAGRCRLNKPQLRRTGAASRPACLLAGALLYEPAAAGSRRRPPAGPASRLGESRLEDIGDITEKIRIGHDNSGINPGWHLDRVEVRRLLPNGKGSEKHTFPCDRWLSSSDEDGEILRELVPSEIFTEKLLKDGTLKRINEEVEDALELCTYNIIVYTGDIFGCGTDANVFLTIYGDLGDTGERQLSSSSNYMNKFERAHEDMFKLQAVDLGTVFKILIRHDNSMPRPDWYLDRVEVVNENTDDYFLFMCERWLSTKKEDGKIERILYEKCYDRNQKSIENASLKDSNANVKDKKSDEVEEPPVQGIMIPYHVIITTGSEVGSDTDSRVYIIISGPGKLRTHRLWLDLPDGQTEFADASVEKFSVLGLDVEDVKKVEVGHDGATPESSWLLDEMTIIVPTKGVMYTFVCKCWLARDMGDGLTSRIYDILDAECVFVGLKILYEITVVTGDVPGGGTDASIYIMLFGCNGNTEEMQLEKDGDRFEVGQTDIFIMEIPDIAPLRKMRVRTDGEGCRPDWFLEQIVMKNLTTQEVTTFTYSEWLSTELGENRTLEWEMPAVINGEQMMKYTNYTVQVKTSDAKRAGTDANLFISIFGESGDTGTLALKKSNQSNKFERDQMDVFVYTDILSLGDLCKVRIWHDNKGFAPGWHLEYVEVEDSLMDKSFRFQCDRWLAKDEDDGQTIRELACANNDILELKERTTYNVLTITSDLEDAETKENVWIILEGKKGRSKEFLLENSTKKRRFLRGAKDEFQFSSKNVGDVAAICVGHCPKDGKKSKSSVKTEVYWHFQEIMITETELSNQYFFRCNAKIPLRSKRDDYKVVECTKVIESFASRARSLVPVKYEVIVVTGFEKGAGTDANVFITIFGANGDSGKRALKQKHRNLFERGRDDRFFLEILELGELRKVRIEHDNTGISPGWLVERVEITNSATGVTTNFPCGKWLDENRGDGQLWRAVFPRN
ncbi:lipoxygenase homology domain-containing protein 1 [Sphaerodactylus townsendi]|nr:lipoxygenase homology domain-containing protein 1 [Sphaerodactylus townsendi]